MVALFKQKITSDFFQIALLLTLLGGEYYLPLHNQNNQLRTDYYGNVLNDVNSTDDILSLSWGNYHGHNRIQNYYDHPAPDLPGKTIRSEYGDFHNYNDSSNGEGYDLAYHQQIIDELRRISLNRRYNNIFDLKAATTYQDITAYLWNNTSNNGLPVGQTVTIAALPEVPPFPASSSSWSSIPSRNTHFTPLSIITDDGHEEILGYERDLGSEDEDVAMGLYYPEIQSKMEVLVAGTSGFSNPDRPRQNQEVPLDTGFSLLDLDLDFLEEQMNIEELQNDLGVKFGEPEGATALDSNENDWPSSTSLWDGELGATGVTASASELQTDLQMAMAFDEVPTPMDLYQGFQDITDEDMMNTISPYEIQGSSRILESKSSSSSKPGSVLDKSNDTTRSRSSDSASFSSHDEVASSGDDEMAEMSEDTTAVDAIFDELWETDSGIFDSALLDGSPNSLSPEHAFDFSNVEDTNSHTDLDTEGSTSPIFDGESSIDDWIQNTEDSRNNLVDDNMIQTAPIHSSVARPTSHPVQPRGFQVHARMPGLLRGGSMEQRWQELAGLLSLQSPQHDPNGGPLHPPLPHHFGAHHHHHHHLHHHPTTLHHHHPMHHPSFAPTGPTATPYTADTARSVLLQNATLPTPELNATYGNVSMGPPPNLGSAVASSMHLTNSSDPLTDPSTHYKMIEPAHDMLYYQNSTNAELNNQTTEGFLSSILNDDDLQLMDMAMNEGMYTMRMLDNSGSGSLPNGPASLPHDTNCSLGATVANVNVTTSEDRMEASSDSAVSSMGSERVPPMTEPPMSENDWSGSDHHPHGSSYSLDYTSGKLRGYDYYGKGETSHRVVVPVAQKKHHMFGKRFQQEQGSTLHPHPYSLSSHPSADLPIPYPSATGLHHPPNGSSLEPLEMKYSCSLDFARHHNDVRIGGSTGSGGIVHTNHTYSLPPMHPENSHLNVRSPRGPAKEKHQKPTKDYKSDEHVSRDEKRARTMGLPMITDEIINLPMDEFNERLSKYDLTEAQLSLIRDIRRRGKNKVAAQNCRKRKLDQITQLEVEVQKIRDRKQNLMREQDNLFTRRNILKDKYSQLYRHVFQALKDPEGSPYSPYEYSLQQAADGSIILVPRNTIQPSTSNCNDSLDSGANSSRRSKSKDDMKKGGGGS